NSEFLFNGVARIALQADSKLIVVGTASFVGTASRGFAVARYNSDGSLDMAFGSGGRVITPFDPSASVGDVAVQADGKIVVAGWKLNARPPVEQLVMTRYQNDGSLDLSFGTNGVISTPNAIVALGLVPGLAIAIQPDNKI